MIRCPSCDQDPYDSALEVCPRCGFEPPTIEGFRAWAPDLAKGGGGFKSDYFSDLASGEKNHFWFTSRNALIIWALEKYFPQFHTYLEVGCGTGFVLSGVATAFPDALISASEVFSIGLKYAAQRVPNARLTQMDARHIPFEQEFDVIGVFDVIEHIVEDDLVLDQLHKALKEGGGLLMTVPQHPWLWSPADDYACHERRYTASQLHALVEAAGFKILRTTSFVSVLLPALILSRLSAKRHEDFDPLSEVRINPLINYLLTNALTIERWLIRMGISMPFGGSRFLAAVKV